MTVAVRPERLELYGLEEPVTTGLNTLQGKVVRRVYFGDVFYYDVDTVAGVIEVKEENRPGVDLHEVGQQAVVAWDPAATTVVGVDHRNGRPSPPREPEEDARRADSRRGFFISLPAWIYLTVFFTVPLVIDARVLVCDEEFDRQDPTRRLESGELSPVVGSAGRPNRRAVDRARPGDDADLPRRCVPPCLLHGNLAARRCAACCSSSS